MNPDLRRRIRVLRIRQRIEMCSWFAYTRFHDRPANGPSHRQVRARLLLLMDRATDDDDHRRLRTTAHGLAWVYRECCDVLHGRRAYTDLAEPLVQTWERITDHGERTVEERCR